MSNELRKAINDYWQSKYPTFAKGRIKRIRAKRAKRTSEKLLELVYKLWNQNNQCHYPITRWNRH